MKECSNLNEFYRLNDIDLKRFIYSKFTFILNEDYTFDDLYQDFYLHMARNKVIEKFDKTKGAKLGTYVFTCLRNFVYCKKQKFDFRNRTIPKIENREPAQIEDTLDLNYLREYLSNIVERQNTIDLNDLVNLYLNGYNDTMIAKKYKKSTACVGARRRILAAHVKSLFEIEGAVLYQRI